MRAPRLICASVCVLALTATLRPPVRADEPPPTPPELTLVVTDPQWDVLSWPQSAEGFYLEEASGLVPPVIWHPVDAVPLSDGDLWRVALPKREGLRFFQLRYDPDWPSIFWDYAHKLAADLPVKAGFSDEFLDLPFLDAFAPWRLAPLWGVPRQGEGGYVLAPGLWEIALQTFCLKAGTGAPGGGDGFVPASFQGPRADLLLKVLDGFSADPSGGQESTQVLLWAMLLRTRMDSLPGPVQALANQWLSEADLQRLNVAADGKHAIEDAYAERFKLWFFGPGGVFEQLPREVQDAILWDAGFEESLASSVELPYEALQELAFAAAEPAEPDGLPPRDIPYGRWAWMPTDGNPPAGYLIRFLVFWYGETLVQFCVPEEITVETDVFGRITRIADLGGNEIHTSYDATVPSLAVAGDDGVTGHAFGEIRLKGPADPEDPRRLLETVHAGVGWVLSGTPAGGGTPGAGARFSDPQGRYDHALSQKAEIRRLDTELQRVHPGRTPGPLDSVARLLDLAEYCEGLRLALLEAEPDDSPEFPYLADRLGLAYRAWVAEFARFCAGEGGAPVRSLPGEPPELAGPPQPGWGGRIKNFLSRVFPRYKPPYYMQAANSGSQNLGLSPVPTNAQTQSGQALQQQYQQAVKPLDKLLSLLSLPFPLKAHRKAIDAGISWNFNLWGRAGDAVNDPEGYAKRHGLKFTRASRTGLAGAGAPSGMAGLDYDVPTVPLFWDYGPVEVDPDITPARLEATTVLIDRLMRVSACLQAATVAIERQYGALQAGDGYWYRLQGAYAVCHERAAGSALWDAAGAIEAWIAVLRDEGVEDPWITREDLEQIIGQLRTEGFSEWKKASFRKAGLSEEAIEECLQASLDWTPELDGYPLFGSLEEVARVSRELGASLMQFPVLPDPASP
ncbi:MAG: hypothetical protein H7A46_04535 [Verrucomicrobiales bacterium]|nr:hypothetical protein [Verrucomicrobiales bacterium]